MPQEVKIQSFLRFCEERFKLSHYLNFIKDTRKKPEILSSMIGASIIMGAALGTRSNRQLDQVLRLPGMRKALGSKRAQVASDTTIARVCEGMDAKTVEQMLANIGTQLANIQLPGIEIGGVRKRVGVVDGTMIGRQLASVVVEAGQVPRVMSIKPMEKRGKELPTSYRAIRHQDKGFVDLLGGDGLYACKEFFTLARRAKVCGFVKTDEKRLHIIRDADGLFDVPKKLPGVEYTQGTDSIRQCTYEVWAVNDMQWSTTNLRLKVARVRECYFKGKYAGQTHTFYVLCQDQGLDAESLRQLGHSRWFIENGVFKAANEQAHTKHCFSRDPHVALIMSMLHMIGMMLVSAYSVFLEAFKHYLRSCWDHGRFSLVTLRQYFWTSLNHGWDSG